MTSKIMTMALLLLAGPLLQNSLATDKLDPPLKLYVFECGKIVATEEDMPAFGLTPEDTDVRTLIVPCFMIEHPKGRLLWDGGLPTAEVKTASLATQLKAMGLGMDSFDYMAFSHTHADHIGVANEVIGATLLIQKAEYDAAFDPNVDIPYFIPKHYEGLRNAKRITLNGDYDVFGDGRVRIISAPGHTPGHQMLYLDLAESGPIMLSGDMYHFQISRKIRAVPTFNTDPATTLKSMDKIEKFIKKTGADLWIEHDFARFEKSRIAPEYYE